MISFKLIFRSWKRNKTFAVISILSLAVGIACTNLLVAFVIHEYNVEAGNPNRNNIYVMTQDSPMESGEKIFYVEGTVAPILTDRYPEVAATLRMAQEDVKDVVVGENRFEPIVILNADVTFPRFFPYKVLEGNLSEALSEPNKIALMERTARRFFGKESPIGRTVRIRKADPGMMWRDPEASLEKNYEVVAVLKEREQSSLRMDAVTQIPPDFWGGGAFVMMNGEADMEAFALRLKEDKVPAIDVENGRYYFHTLQEDYFQPYSVQRLSFTNRQQKSLLLVGVISALLILLIACFNYINLNFSRLLQQIRMIHTQKLMGASGFHINSQLFLDTFLTVLTGFLLSLLIMYDLLPQFNKVMSGRMPPSFFFDAQVLPGLCGFVLILSVVPSVYVSRKVNRLSQQGYKEFFTGKKRQVIVSFLSTTQFVISIALIMGTLNINRQIDFIQKGGEGYKGLIEIEGASGENSTLPSFARDLRSRPEIKEVLLTELPFLHGWLRQIVVRNEDGSETFIPQMGFRGDIHFLKTFRIRVIQGLEPEEALARFPNPVYINERYAQVLVTDGSNPVGKPIKSYDSDYNEGSSAGTNGDPEASGTVIAGIVGDFHVNSMEHEVYPAVIHIRKNMDDIARCVYVRLDPAQPQLLSTVQHVWEEHNPDKQFTYRNVYDDFLARNQKAFDMARLLLMYSLISILLTCFGLFGMTLYATQQRTKEVGIRKVNGASTLQVMNLLNRQFVGWVFVAFVIAVPVTWILLNRWLENFVYRVEVSLWFSLFAGIIVLLITLLTVSWHSYKAASGNPVNALRNE